MRAIVLQGTRDAETEKDDRGLLAEIRRKLRLLDSSISGSSMMESAIGTANSITIDIRSTETADSFERAIEIICDSLSVSSRRVYQNTYRAWRAFSAAHAFAVMDVTFDNIRAFINQADVAKSTRQNRLSHMRKLLGPVSCCGPWLPTAS